MSLRVVPTSGGTYREVIEAGSRYASLRFATRTDSTYNLFNAIIFLLLKHV